MMKPANANPETGPAPDAAAPEDRRVTAEPADRPGKAWLELNGSILIYHRESWVLSSSLFIPVEWVSAHTSKKRDIRRLWRGILGLMTAFLLSLPLAVIVRILPPLYWTDIALGAFLGALLAVALGAGAWSLIRYFQPRNITLLKVNALPYPQTYAFWHPPGGAPALDQLIERLAAVRVAAEAALPYPIRMNHLWRRPRPYRIALLKGLAVSFVLYFVFLTFEAARWYGAAGDFPRALYLLIAAPPLFYTGAQFLRFRRGGALPRAYLHAVRAYVRGDLHAAQERLDALLSAAPEHAPGRTLMIQVCAQQYAIEDAFRHCAALSRDHPALAGQLQSTLWDIKRLRERMDY